MFTFESEDVYRRWRDAKLAGYPRRPDDLVVEMRDARNPRPSEIEQIRRLCRIANMAIYSGPPADEADRSIPRRVGASLGLVRLDANLLADEDGISSLRVTPGKSVRGYIPYSAQRLLWHTDGYYNAPEQSIRAFLLHCVRPAAEGGDNRLLDHEIAYILLRDAGPGYVRALSAADAMTIPANCEEGSEIRPARSGPVFSVDADSGALQMRFTARTRSIEWRRDQPTRDAVDFLRRILDGDSPWVFRCRLESGQGLVCNNVLHDRSAFNDPPAPGPGRLVYRARYADRVALA